MGSVVLTVLLIGYLLRCSTRVGKMSWPSAYGYKYTPIGLRQRDIVEESGKRTVSTTVHLPEGGHLLDIERKYAPDGSIAKKETSCFPPSQLSAPTPTPLQREATPLANHAPLAHAPTPARDLLPPSLEFEPSHQTMSDLEKKADDIIANFRARHQTGFDA